MVGQQSSGKSSVLESITGFPFPRGAGLCTRYPTEISCRSDDVSRTTVSIRPQAGVSPERAAKLQEFRVDVTDLDPRSPAFEDIFRKVSFTCSMPVDIWCIKSIYLGGGGNGSTDWRRSR